MEYTVSVWYCVFHGTLYPWYTVLCISWNCRRYFMELCIPQYCVHGSVYPTVLNFMVLCIPWYCVFHGSVSHGTVYFMELCILWYCVFHGTCIPWYCVFQTVYMVLCIPWYCVFQYCLFHEIPQYWIHRTVISWNTVSHGNTLYPMYCVFHGTLYP